MENYCIVNETKKDTETLAENVEPLYAVKGKPGPKQHLSHPTQPVIFGREPTVSKKSGIHKNV